MKISLSISLVFSFNILFGQLTPNCDSTLRIILCYLPSNSYCLDGGIFNCSTTLNDSIQANGTLKKLKNPRNFGANGISSCNMSIRPILVSNQSDLSEAGCNILYTGLFPLWSENNFDLDQTAIPKGTLDAIYQWSIEDPNNLVITSQAEATRWGYKFEDLNINPNYPISGNDPIYDIFSGPFGNVESFNQGGPYQGIITEGPTTGYTVLAIDSVGEPTIVLDNVTQDVILGDIGFFSSYQFGSVSLNQEVQNDNDRFVCNLFSLACPFAQSDFEIFTFPYVPNAFSPNSDGINDSFEIFFNPRVIPNATKIKDLNIFDRWGNNIRSQVEIIPTENDLELWNGYINERIASSGVYVYQFTIEYPSCEKHFSGQINVLR